MTAPINRPHTLEDLIKLVEDNRKDQARMFHENGGMCLVCEQNPGVNNDSIPRNIRYMCTSCAEDFSTDEIAKVMKNVIIS